MIRDAAAHLFDVVVVHKLDRFSRSLLDMLMYLNRLHAYGGSLVSATEPFDFSTPIGKVVLAVLGAFAQWYVDKLAAEVRKGKKRRARAGDWNGVLSFGYTTPRRLREALIALGTQFKDGMVVESEYSYQAELIEDTLWAISRKRNIRRGAMSARPKCLRSRRADHAVAFLLQVEPGQFDDVRVVIDHEDGFWHRVSFLPPPSACGCHLPRWRGRPGRG